jgi:hypothetical protein
MALRFAMGPAYLVQLRDAPQLPLQLTSLRSLSPVLCSASKRRHCSSSYYCACSK